MTTAKVGGMPGSPIKRAKREREFNVRQSMIEALEQGEHRREHSVHAPLSSDESHARVDSVRDLYRSMLDGANAALAQMHAGMAAGLDAREIKELAVTSNVLMRAAKLIEDNKPTDEPPSLAELEAAEAEAARIYAARKGRG